MLGRIFQTSRIRFWSFAFLLMAVAPGWAEEPVDTAEIAEWVAELDDDRYVVRENAQGYLEQAGVVAIDAVAEVSQSGSLESSTRAINIMLFWSESPDRSLRVVALEKLVALPNRPKESKIAAKLLLDAREEEALEAIVALGGYHNLYPKPPSGQLPQVVIGSKWKGSVADLKHLSAVRRAKMVSFYSAPIDDTAIVPLLDLDWIEHFEFYGTRKVSEAAIARLKKRFPHAKIRIRSGALLGVQCELSSATIRFVQPKSAAEKAGLMPGDQITEFDGEKIQDFDTLTAHIAEHEPGDTVKLTIVRNRTPVQITVKFDRWGRDNVDVGKPTPPPIRLERR